MRNDRPSFRVRVLMEVISWIGALAVFALILYGIVYVVNEFFF